MDILSRDSRNYQFKGKILHDFQTKAIKCVERNESVIVSTHTGNGKTLIAEAAIELCKKEGKKIIYTAPIKALSNQKLKQFKEDDDKECSDGKFVDLRKQYGENLVGMMTGDRVINPDAPILLMTTEILCNMLYDQPERVQDTVKYIVFDEIHNLADKDRGTIWEESLILKPNGSHIIGLSATIPNVKELCDWINALHNEKVNDIVYKERLTPLSYSYFHKDYGQCTHEQLLNKLKSDNRSKKGFTHHIDFIKFAKEKNLLNVLGFFNSRNKCEVNAEELSSSFNFLNISEKKQVEKILLKYNDSYPELSQVRSWRVFEQTALNGVFFYHSGLVPIIKDACEEFLNNGLGRVCYGTDAISQGINIPFKTVFMENLIDAHTKTHISGAVFKQRAGRAGRKGFDEKGYVYVLANIEPDEVVDLKSIDGEIVKSQLKLPFNRVIKHLHRDIDTFLESSFANFQYMNELGSLSEHGEKTKNKLDSELENLSSKINCRDFNDPKCPIINKDMKKEINLLENELKSCATPEEKEKLLNRINVMRQLVKSALNPIRCAQKNPANCIRHYSRINDLNKEVLKTNIELEEAKKNSPITKLKEEFNNKTKLLQHLNFIDKNNNLLYKGNLCSKIYIEELLVSQLIENGLFYSCDVDMINSYLAGIVYENGKKFKSFYDTQFDTSFIDNTIEYLIKEISKFQINHIPNFNKLVCPIMYDWSLGKPLTSITENCTMFEGDFINICKNTIELLTQIKNACPQEEFVISKVDECMKKINRDIVSLSF